MNVLNSTGPQSVKSQQVMSSELLCACFPCLELLNSKHPFQRKTSAGNRKFLPVTVLLSVSVYVISLAVPITCVNLNSSTSCAHKIRLLTLWCFWVDYSFTCKTDIITLTCQEHFNQQFSVYCWGLKPSTTSSIRLPDLKYHTIQPSWQHSPPRRRFPTANAIHGPIKLSKAFKIFSVWNIKVLKGLCRKKNKETAVPWAPGDCAILIYLGHMINIPMAAAI